MWRSKKFITITLVAIVLLVGSTIGIVFAQEETEETTPAKLTMLDRVAEKLSIEPQVLKDAFTEVRSEMRDEAQDGYLQKMVDYGKITQDEADQYQEWWQSRPDTELFGSYKGSFGFGGFRGGMKWGGGHTGWGGHTASETSSS